MNTQQKSKKDKELEEQFHGLAKVFEEKGIAVRREKLSRGPSFRVKSGECFLTGKKLLFVDKRLPVDQQISLLQDYLIEN